MSYRTSKAADTGLILYYPLDETSGSTAADAAGGGNDGTASGATLGGAAGIPADGTGLAALFHGTSDTITPASATGFPTGNVPWTMEAWINISHVPSGVDGGVMAWGDLGTNADGIELSVFSDTEAVAYNQRDAASPDAASLPTLTGAWHHFVVTYDGTTRILYWDGVNEASDTPAALTLTATLPVLGFNSIDDALFGAMAHMAIYSRALSGTEVLAWYTLGSTPPSGAPDPPTGLAATYSEATGHIELTWTASVTPGVTYTVLRSTTSGGETSYATGITGTHYSDTSFNVDTTYYYTVVAVDGGGTSTPTSEVAAADNPRTVTLTGTAIDGGGNPNPTGTVSLHLLVPGGGNAIHTVSGALINRDPPNPTPDPVTATWTAQVIAPGDITPAGCEWQVSAGAAQPIISPSFAWTSSTINVTSWIGNPSRMGLLKMFLTAIEGNALIDAGATFGVTISGDATWTGTGGAGELVQAGAPPIQTTVDSFGNVYYYLIPMAALTPVPSVTTTLFYQSPTRTGQLLWTCPTAYTDDQGTYASGTTYDIGDVVRDPANNYEPYISLVGSNIGNTPSASPTEWADYAGESITAHLILGATAGQQVAGTANIAPDPQQATGIYAVPAVSLQDQLRQMVQSIPGLEYRLLTMPAGPKTFGAYNVFF